MGLHWGVGDRTDTNLHHWEMVITVSTPAVIETDGVLMPVTKHNGQWVKQKFIFFSHNKKLVSRVPRAFEQLCRPFHLSYVWDVSPHSYWCGHTPAPHLHSSKSPRSRWGTKPYLHEPTRGLLLRLIGWMRKTWSDVGSAAWPKGTMSHHPPPHPGPGQGGSPLPPPT